MDFASEKVFFLDDTFIAKIIAIFKKIRRLVFKKSVCLCIHLEFPTIYLR